MTPARFRKLALALPGAEEKSHMDHPDFRVNGKIFATLSRDESQGMVTIPPELQRTIVTDGSEAFEPCAGAWGRNGSTKVFLETAPAALVKALLHEAWTLAVSKTAKKPAKAKRPKKAAR